MQIVTEFLSKEPVGISEAQLDQFRDLLDVLEDSLAFESESNNFRPMQPLNGRDLLLVFADATNRNPNIVLILAFTIFWFIS